MLSQDECPDLFGLLYVFHTPSLLNQEGSLIAYAGKSEKKEHITAAIAANIWMSYEKNSREAMEDEPMQLIVMECEVRGEDEYATW